MNEIFEPFEFAFGFISEYPIIFLLPFIFFTFHISISLVKIMCRPRHSLITERLSVSAVSDKKSYIPPLLDLQPCPVSDFCSDCRFYNTDSCLRGYLRG